MEILKSYLTSPFCVLKECEEKMYYDDDDGGKYHIIILRLGSCIFKIKNVLKIAFKLHSTSLFFILLGHGTKIIM